MGDEILSNFYEISRKVLMGRVYKSKLKSMEFRRFAFCLS